MSGYKHEIIIINAFSATVVQRLSNLPSLENIVPERGDLISVDDDLYKVMSRKYDYNTEVVATGQDSNDVTLLVTVVLYVGRAQSEKAIFGN